jgi:hypothetical protein
MINITETTHDEGKRQKDKLYVESFLLANATSDKKRQKIRRHYHQRDLFQPIYANGNDSAHLDERQIL